MREEVEDQVDDVRAGFGDVQEQVEDEAVEPAARLGLVGKGVMYVVLGLLAALIGFGVGEDLAASSAGAIAAVSRQPFGTALVAALALGLTSYAVWRALQVVVGVDGSDLPKPLLRVTFAFRALLYGVLAFLAWRTVLTGSDGGGNAEESLTARVLQLPVGQALVIAVALGVIGVGAYQVKEGVTDPLRHELPRTELTARQRRWLEPVGRAGLVARGLVFAVAGVFLINAAVQRDAQEGAGLDGALRQLAETSFGMPMLLAAAVGLALYGFFCLVMARVCRVEAID